MVITDKEAKWVEAQRKKVVDAITEIASIIAKENLLPGEGRVYDIDLDLGTSGNQITIRVWKDGELIAEADAWCLSEAFDYSEYYRFNKERSHNKIKSLLNDLRRLKALAVKYVR